MSKIIGLYICDDNHKLVFNYPMKSSCPVFEEILNRIKSLNSNSDSIDENSVPPIVQFTSRYLIFHYSTKYLYSYAVCEVGPKKENFMRLRRALNLNQSEDQEEGYDTTLENSGDEKSEREDNGEAGGKYEGGVNVFNGQGDNEERYNNNEEKTCSEEDAAKEGSSEEVSSEEISSEEDSSEEQSSEEGSSEEDGSSSEDDREEFSDDELYQVNDHSTDNPLVPLEFLKQFISTLNDYLGAPLVSIKLKTNYDVVCLLLNEMVEDHYPFITDLNQLKELVHKDGAFRKLITSATRSIPNNGASTLTGRSNMNNATGMRAISSKTFQKEESYIPWRKSNVKYSNNELFVDFIEEVNLIMTPSHKKTKPKNNDEAPINNTSIKGSAFYSTSNDFNLFKNYAKPLVAKLEGQVTLTTHLSGIPDLKMVLNLAGHDLKVPSFHPCVRVDKWLDSPGTMSFIPPDGKCILANYEVDLTESIFTKNKNREILRNIGIIHCEFKTGLGSNKDEFEIVLHVNLREGVKSIENLKVIVNSDRMEDQSSNIKTLRLTNGDFQFNSNGRSEWILEDNLPTGINPIFRGQIVTEQPTAALFPKYVSVSFNYKGSLPSGIKVDSLKVVSARNMGESVNPFKGVKYLAKSGDYILR